MKTRIYKTFQAYQNYLDFFYKNRPNLVASTFQDQKSALEYDGFPWILSWGQNNTNKNVEIFETIHNNDHLQNAWSSDLFDQEKSQVEIVIEQIRIFQPHIVVLYPPELFTKDILDEIRATINHEVLIVGYDGINRKNLGLYEGYHLIITCSDYISEFYKKGNFQTYTLTFCFDKDILNRIRTSSGQSFNVGFSGSIYPDVHSDRYKFVKYLALRADLQIRSDFGIDQNFGLFKRNQRKRLLRGEVSDYLALNRIEKCNCGPVYGLDMFQFLNDSKIVINKHIDNINFAANVRMFEATGVGSCLLTDWKENIAELFEPGVEVETYKSKEEALDKIKYLLKHEHERQKIALAGQRRTLENYTYRKKIPEVINFLKREFM